MTQTVMVPLASDALYVSGTVNGVEVVWTRQEGNYWSAQAEKSDTGVYHVALTIIYGNGKTTSDSITLYYGLVLVTDRTQSDVANGTEKGYYNASDLNRVGAAVTYLRDRFTEYGYIVDVAPKIGWVQANIPTESDMTLYLANIGVIQGVIPLPDFTPEIPESMDNLTFTEANNIERVLEIADQMLTNSLIAVWYSGDILSGEVI